MKRSIAHRIWHGVAFFAVLALVVLVVMSLWNWILPGVTGWGVITYWQALGLLILCKILFGGFAKGHHFHHGHKHMHKRFKKCCGNGENNEDTRLPDEEEIRNMHQRFHGMSRAERKEYIRRHMAGFADFCDGPGTGWQGESVNDAEAANEKAE